MPGVEENQAKNMRLISSTMTGWHKRGFPLCWFGFLTVWILLTTFAMFKKGEFQITPLVIPILIGAFGFLCMKLLIFDLVDGVWEDDNSLLIKNAGIEDRIALANIVNASSSTFTNPQRITLTLGEHSIFGEKIVFCPPYSFCIFWEHPLAQELNRKIEEQTNGDNCSNLPERPPPA